MKLISKNVKSKHNKENAIEDRNEANWNHKRRSIFNEKNINMNMFFNNEIYKSIFDDNVHFKCGIFKSCYTVFSIEYPNDIQWDFTNRLKKVALCGFESKFNFYNYDC